MSKNQSNAATLEIAALTKIQAKLHSSSNKSDVVSSPFTYEFRKRSWYVQVTDELSQVPSDDHTTFTASDKYDFISHTYLTVNIPEIEVKAPKAMRIRFPRNPANHLIKSVELRFNDTTIQTFDPESLDDWVHYFVAPGKRDLLNRIIGNTYYYQTWSKKLPSSEIGLPLPFFSGNGTAIPLFYSTLSKVSYRCVFKKDLSKLIMMMVRTKKAKSEAEKDTWKRTPFNLDYLKPGNLNFGKFRMWGRYSVITDEEREWRKNSDPLKILVENFETIRHGLDPQPSGKTVSIKLSSSNPVTFLTWKARHTRSMELNDYSNYTTSHHDSDRGWNPIESSYIQHTGNPRDQTKSSIHSECFEPYFHTRTCSQENGYNCKSFSRLSHSRDVQSGCVFDRIDPILMIKIGSTDPYLAKSKLTMNGMPSNGTSSDGKINSSTMVIAINDISISTPSTTESNDLYEIILRARSTRIVTISKNGMSLSEIWTKINSKIR